MTLEQQVHQNDVKLKKAEEKIKVLERIVKDLISTNDKYSLDTQNNMLNLIK